MVVQQHHQNIQMRGQNLMLKKIIATVDVNFHLHNPDVTYIASLTNISTTLRSDIKNSPTHEHFHRHLLPEK